MAHILFTSGSTGVPKGVVIEHRNVTAFLDWASAHFQPRASDRISGHPPLHFDLSTFDIYGTLGAGAELHLVPAAANVHPRSLAAFIRDAELTQWFSVPSVLTYLAKFDVVAQDDFPALERLLWCGEVLPTPVLAHWMDRLPHVRFTNLYGPTEATIASSFHDVPERPADEREPVPIGVACDGEELLVLDEEDGDRARSAIARGAGLSPGYWRDEEKTAQAFVADPRGGGGRVYRTGDLGRVGRRRGGPLPGPRRLADQEPRLPDRAGRDGDGRQRGRRRARVRRGRRRVGRVRGHRDLLRLRRRAAGSARAARGASPTRCPSTCCPRAGSPSTLCPRT